MEQQLIHKGCGGEVREGNEGTFKCGQCGDTLLCPIDDGVEAVAPNGQLSLFLFGDPPIQLALA